MTKKLNESALTSELSGSVFFTRPNPTPTPPPQTKVAAVTPAKIKARSVKRTVSTKTVPTKVIQEGSTSGRTPVLPYARTNNRRTITRYAFEFFQDQLETLKRLSLDQQYRGEKGSMSQMVREALDAYIARILNQEDGDRDVRSPVRPNGGD